MSKKNTRKYLNKAQQNENTETKQPMAAKSNAAKSSNKFDLYGFLRQFINRKYSFSLLLIGLVTVLFIVFKDYLFMYKALLFRGIGSDTITIFYSGYLHYFHAMNSETAGLWSFWAGMGQAGNPAYSSFGVFTLLLDIVYKIFVTNINEVAFGITFQIVVTIFSLGLTTYAYLRTVKLEYFGSLIGSLLFSFSGFVLVGTGWHHYPYAAFSFIFLLLSFELLLQKRIWILIPFAVLLIGGLNVYMYFNVVFLFFYSLFRFIDVYGFKPKKLVSIWLIMALLGIVGIGLTSSGLVNTYFTTVEAPRFAGNVASFAPKLSQTPVFSFESDTILNRGITGNHYKTALLRMYSPDIIGTGAMYVGWNNYLEGPNFYVGLISLLLLPILFFNLKGFKRWLYAGFFALWLLPVIFPYFRHAFHLFIGNYYKMTFNLYIPLVILFFSLQSLNEILEKRKINLIALAITWFVLIIVLFFQFYPETIQSINTEIRAFAIVFLTAYAVLLYLLSNRKISVYAKYLIYLLVVIELSYFGYISLNERVLPGTEQSAVVTRGELRLRSGYNDFTVEAIDYIRKMDKGFYRVEKDYQSGDAMHGSLNDAMAQNYFGTASYSSFNDIDYVNFMAGMDLINPNNEAETRWIRGFRGNPFLMHWASVKYFLSSPTQTDPAFPSSSYLKMGFDSLTQFYDVKVLKNRYYLPLGFTYDKVIYESDFLKLKKEVKESVLLKNLIIKDQDSILFANFERISSLDTTAIRTYDELANVIAARTNPGVEMTSFKQDNISYAISVKKEQALFFSIPHHIGWQAYIDGKEVPVIKSNIGFMSVILPKGKYALNLKFTPYLMKESIAVQTGFELLYGGMIVFFFVSEFKRRRKEKQNAGNENKS